MLALHAPLIHHCFWALCRCYTQSWWVTQYAISRPTMRTPRTQCHYNFQGVILGSSINQGLCQLPSSGYLLILSPIYCILSEILLQLATHFPQFFPFQLTFWAHAFNYVPYGPIRGLPYMTATRYLDFLTPPSLSAIFKYWLSANVGYFYLRQQVYMLQLSRS